jgi:dipeptidyl aminopeptidase/acylaminoacyl peptidase
MSDRLYAFNQPAVNHRPSFPVYASDGYVVFLPDVRFEVGRPGFASTKSVVPGVQHLIDIGLADPDAICLHGHSWSGYQTAFMVTQTNIFKTAIAGAPVGNMTSAYSGIRLGSGLARQFQYEMTQSRLSGSLWEARDDYIDNSPVFFADKIQTPMLILHGDVDDAVPWEQSIELYLAMRRNGKEAVFLQYRDEPHHPQTYANKLDWATKMKEWVDYYLKGEGEPTWIVEGMPYSGR